MRKREKTLKSCNEKSRKYRWRIKMKVGEVTQGLFQNPNTTQIPVIKAEEIKSILYLGIRGNIKLSTDGKSNSSHTIDMFA